jgi:hypothetical protein
VNAAIPQRRIVGRAQAFDFAEQFSQPYMPPPEEETGRLGYSDFSPALMTKPLGWW